MIINGVLQKWRQRGGIVVSKKLEDSNVEVDDHTIRSNVYYIWWNEDPETDKHGYGVGASGGRGTPEGNARGKKAER